MVKRGLPPLIAGYEGPHVKWVALPEVDVDFLGYLLACHLIIENYIDHFLQRWPYGNLAWEGARLQFSQKVALISRFTIFATPYDFVPSIKHLNSLRNKFVHRLDTVLTAADFEPQRAVLRKVAKEGTVVPDDPMTILEHYTGVVCAWFAGVISRDREVFGAEAKKLPPA
jgi:hypothetical protein